MAAESVLAISPSRNSSTYFMLFLPSPLGRWARGEGQLRDHNSVASCALRAGPGGRGRKTYSWSCRYSCFRHQGQGLLGLFRIEPGERVTDVDDDVVADRYPLDQCQRDVLTHAAQFDDGLVAGGDFNDLCGNG